jgi:hypothetical protein
MPETTGKPEQKNSKDRYRFVIVHTKLGVLLGFTTGGTLWTANVAEGEHPTAKWAAITFTEEEGKEAIGRFNEYPNPEIKAEDLKLVEVFCDLHPCPSGNTYRVSRKELASRLLVPDA